MAAVSVFFYARSTALHVLDVTDNWVNNVVLVSAAGLAALAVAFAARALPELARHLNAVSSFKVGRLWMLCVAVITPAVLVREPVETVEGLAAESADLRAEFADTGAFQCGFCTPGQVVHATALLRDGLPPGAEERRTHVRHELSGNICRCTGYQAIVESVCAVADAREGVRS